MIKKLKSNPLPVIFFTLFVNALGFGILIPIIPLLLANPRSEFYLLPTDWSVSQGYVLLGYLVAIFPFMQFFATPILGQLSDKFGRKPILAFSLAGTFLSYAFFAYAVLIKNIPLLFISRAIDGITGGNISVAQASIADVTDPAHRARNFGLIGAAFGLGFILGPYLGGKLSDPSVVSWFNPATPFWFASILSLLNVFFILFFFTETHQHMRLELNIDWSKSVHNILKAYSLKNLRLIFIANFLYIAGFTFYTTFGSVFLYNRFHLTQGGVGDFFAYTGLWVAISQGLLTRFIAGKFKEEQIVRVSMMVGGLALLAYFLPREWWQLLLVSPFFAMSNAMTLVNTTALVSKSVDARVQGEVLGISASVQALAQSIPPVLSGYIAASITPDTPLMVAANIMILAGVVFWLFYRHYPPAHLTE